MLNNTTKFYTIIPTTVFMHNMRYEINVDINLVINNVTLTVSKAKANHLTEVSPPSFSTFASAFVGKLRPFRNWL